MQQIPLKTRVYGPYANRLMQDLTHSLQQKFSKLDVAFTKVRTNKRGYVSVTLTGSDEEFVANSILSEYDTCPTFEELTEQSTLSGWLIDVGKVGYGLYVDIGIHNPETIDVLVPLHRLREQLELPRRSLRQIAKSLLLVDNLPVEVIITSIDRRNLTIEGSLSEQFLDRLDKWMNDEHERLFVFGANYSMIERALEKTHHIEDIYEVESIGVHEHVLVCKRSTRASGIIAAIGPKLRGVPMHIFIPREVKAMRDGAT